MFSGRYVALDQRAAYSDQIAAHALVCVLYVKSLDEIREVRRSGENIVFWLEDCEDIDGVADDFLLQPGNIFMTLCKMARDAFFPYCTLAFETDQDLIWVEVLKDISEL
jgi:hypothetical protein